MKVTILTLFPEIFAGPLNYSILKRAIENKLLQIEYVNIRTFGLGSRRSVDDRPYGGGVGMVMRVDVINKALESVNTPRGCAKYSPGAKNQRIILLDPKGKKFDQAMARRFSKLDHLILVCGHYEGVDARVNKLVDEMVSIGDYVLTGGEIPAMVIVDSVARLLPGVLSKPEAIINESFQVPTSHFPHPTLEYPQYTRPRDFKGMKVPKILLSGDHKKIEKWQRKQAEKLSKNFPSSKML